MIYNTALFTRTVELFPADLAIFYKMQIQKYEAVFSAVHTLHTE